MDNYAQKSPHLAILSTDYPDFLLKTAVFLRVILPIPLFAFSVLFRQLSLAKDIFYLITGLVQQTVQIVVRCALTI
jgi:hypothetical protein